MSNDDTAARLVWHSWFFQAETPDNVVSRRRPSTTSIRDFNIFLPAVEYLILFPNVTLLTIFPCVLLRKAVPMSEMTSALGTQKGSGARNCRTSHSHDAVGSTKYSASLRAAPASEACHADTVIASASMGAIIPCLRKFENS